DASLADVDLTVRTEDAFAMVRRLAREEGILAGVSSGAALCACLRVAEKLQRDEKAIVVTVFPDSGDRYLTERFWDEKKVD
ncbi:MAG: pyridoxal-phosphate dependent enzyme, partial [Candidatus Acidiferrales bacterium]